MYNMHYIYALSYATTSSRTCCPGVTCDTSWLQSGICDNDLWPLLGAPSNTNTNFLDFKILSIDIVSTRNVKVRRNNYSNAIILSESCIQGRTVQKKGANKTQRKKYKIFYDQLRKVPDIPIGVLQIRWQAWEPVVCVPRCFPFRCYLLDL